MLKHSDYNKCATKQTGDLFWLTLYIHMKVILKILSCDNDTVPAFQTLRILDVMSYLHFFVLALQDKKIVM